jgi:hypothetical protein
MKTHLLLLLLTLQLEHAKCMSARMIQKANRPLRGHVAHD